jgi:hypothetical protein
MPFFHNCRIHYPLISVKYLEFWTVFIKYDVLRTEENGLGYTAIQYTVAEAIMHVYEIRKLKDVLETDDKDYIWKAWDGGHSRLFDEAPVQETGANIKAEQILYKKITGG